MNYYTAKFEREAKEKPEDWIINPIGNGFILVYIGSPSDSA